MIPKPVHLEPQYGAQFKDASVVAAYHHRPPYPEAVFPLLVDLIADGPRIVLDVGCGTGDIARRLAPLVERLDALDFSAPMIEKGKALPGGDHPALYWIEGAAEDTPLSPPYGLIVAGESLHWMDWEVVFPRLRTMLGPGAILAIIGRGTLAAPWDELVQSLINRYSTNRDFKPYDFLEELTKRRLFTLDGACSTLPEVIEQPVESFIESFHSRNGFSRDRMTVRNAKAFDSRLSEAVRPWVVDGCVPLRHNARLMWGLPEMRQSGATAG
ncbi:MAG TPA: class I SAM-dependent methyltransferase [Dehalococcoidia bacterium]|nr:class I SAM-dependent methyltransferase [Dehalococcoidia bacterium]